MIPQTSHTVQISRVPPRPSTKFLQPPSIAPSCKTCHCDEVLLQPSCHRRVQFNSYLHRYRLLSVTIMKVCVCMTVKESCKVLHSCTIEAGKQTVNTLKKSCSLARCIPVPDVITLYFFIEACALVAMYSHPHVVPQEGGVNERSIRHGFVASNRL